MGKNHTVALISFQGDSNPNLPLYISLDQLITEEGRRDWGVWGGECEGGGGRVRIGRRRGRDSVGTTMLKPKAADRSSIISTC